MHKPVFFKGYYFYILLHFIMLKYDNFNPGVYTKVFFTQTDSTGCDKKFTQLTGFIYCSLCTG